MSGLEQDIENITLRNQRVAADKAWETSATRRAAITLGTYFIVWAYLSVIGVNDAFLHALVPSGAFLVSTLTMPQIKGMWLRRIYKQNPDQ